MDRGAWRATVHAVARSRTRLSNKHNTDIHHDSVFLLLLLPFFLRMSQLPQEMLSTFQHWGHLWCCCPHSPWWVTDMPAGTVYHRWCLASTLVALVSALPPDSSSTYSVSPASLGLSAVCDCPQTFQWLKTSQQFPHSTLACARFYKGGRSPSARTRSVLAGQVLLAGVAKPEIKLSKSRY